MESLPLFHPRDYDKLLIAAISCSCLPEPASLSARRLRRTAHPEMRAARGLVSTGEQNGAAYLPKRDCEAVNNLLENIFLCPSHRSTNPPCAALTSLADNVLTQLKAC